MIQQPLPAPSTPAGKQAISDAWRRWGRTAGYVAGSAFLLQTVLFLLDATGMLAPQIGFVDTPATVMETWRPTSSPPTNACIRSGGMLPCAMLPARSAISP